MDLGEGEPLNDVTKSEFISKHRVTGTIAEPENYRITAVIAAICFWPTGLISLYHSLQVQDLYRRGDIIGAIRASQQADYYVILTHRLLVFFCCFLFLLLSAWLLLALCYALDSRIQ